MLLAVGAPASSQAALSSTPDDIAVAEGTVNAVAVGADGRTYLGGSFTGVGPRATGGGVVDPTTGTLQSGLRASGVGLTSIKASVPDGSGGYYLGGTFSSLQGVAVSNLAHLRSDGTVDPAFNPSPIGGGSSVNALALSANGSTIYAGGVFLRTFSDGNGQFNTGTKNLASFDTSNGETNTGFNPQPSSTNSDTSLPLVNALALSSDGNTIYAGGAFTSTVNGATTQSSGRRLARIRTGDGETVTAFNPRPSDAINAVALTTDGTQLYAGGDFSVINAADGTARLGRFSTADGASATTFRPQPNGTVSALALTADENAIFVGGAFSSTSTSSTTPRLARVTTLNGATDTSFDPRPDAAVTALSLAPGEGTVYAGGSFTTTTDGDVPGTVQSATPRLARFNAANGDADPSFVARPGRAVATLSRSPGGALFVGGAMQAMNAYAPKLAALRPDGTVDPAFDPQPNGDVSALALSGTSLYAGGRFTTTVNGAATQSGTRNLAKVSTVDGETDVSFAPQPSDLVSALAMTLDGSTIYAGGFFTTTTNSTGPQNLTPMLAKIATVNGETDTNFNPRPDALTSALAVTADGSTLYAGGQFRITFNDTTPQAMAPSLAKIATVDGETDPAFDPTPDNSILSLALSPDENSIYAGGFFTETQNGPPENHTTNTLTRQLARFGTTDGDADPAFNPQPNAAVGSLLLAGTSIFASGGFTTTVNGSSAQFATPRLARIGIADGETDTSFSPQLSAGANALAGSATRLVAGGAIAGYGPEIIRRPGVLRFSDTAATAANWRGATVRRTARGNRVSWRAADRASTVAFDVLRVRRGGRRVKVNRRAIVAIGARAGAAFSVLDRSGRRGDRYLVVQRRVSGPALVHGPYRVRTTTRAESVSRHEESP